MADTFNVAAMQAYLVDQKEAGTVVPVSQDRVKVRYPDGTIIEVGISHQGKAGAAQDIIAATADPGSKKSVTARMIFSSASSGSIIDYTWTGNAQGGTEISDSIRDRLRLVSQAAIAGSLGIAGDLTKALHAERALLVEKAETAARVCYKDITKPYSKDTQATVILRHQKFTGADCPAPETSSKPTNGAEPPAADKLAEHHAGEKRPGEKKDLCQVGKRKPVPKAGIHSDCR
jgi:hypothetical protein